MRTRNPLYWLCEESLSNESVNEPRRSFSFCSTGPFSDGFALSPLLAPSTTPPLLSPTLSIPIYLFISTVSLFLSFPFVLSRYTRTHVYSHRHIRLYTLASTYRSLLFPFISSARSPASTEAGTNSCTLIQFVRIKDAINNVFSR